MLGNRNVKEQAPVIGEDRGGSAADFKNPGGSTKKT